MDNMSNLSDSESTIYGYSKCVAPLHYTQISGDMYYESIVADSITELTYDASPIGCESSHPRSLHDEIIMGDICKNGLGVMFC